MNSRCSPLGVYAPADLVQWTDRITLTKNVILILKSTKYVSPLLSGVRLLFYLRPSVHTNVKVPGLAHQSQGLSLLNVDFFLAESQHKRDKLVEDPAKIGDDDLLAGLGGSGSEDSDDSERSDGVFHIAVISRLE